MAKWLVSCGADLSARNAAGATALDEAQRAAAAAGGKKVQGAATRSAAELVELLQWTASATDSDPLWQAAPPLAAPAAAAAVELPQQPPGKPKQPAPAAAPRQNTSKPPKTAATAAKLKPKPKPNSEKKAFSLWQEEDSLAKAPVPTAEQNNEVKEEKQQGSETEEVEKVEKVDEVEEVEVVVVVAEPAPASKPVAKGKQPGKAKAKQPGKPKIPPKIPAKKQVAAAAATSGRGNPSSGSPLAPAKLPSKGQQLAAAKPPPVAKQPAPEVGEDEEKEELKDEEVGPEAVDGMAGEYICAMKSMVREGWEATTRKAGVVMKGQTVTVVEALKAPGTGAIRCRFEGLSGAAGQGTVSGWVSLATAKGQTILQPVHLQP